MNDLLNAFSYILIFIGLLMIFSAVVGCQRFPDYFSKMHAATIGDVVGCPMILLGLALQSNSLIMAIKIILLAFILLIVNPTASFILNKIALKHGLSPGIKKGDDNA
jgi:multicomponent Na+:H+ antiporter subunit G